jgi:hypothetical protein
VTDPLVERLNAYDLQLVVLALIDRELDARWQRIHQLAHEDPVDLVWFGE